MCEYVYINIVSLTPYPTLILQILDIRTLTLHVNMCMCDALFWGQLKGPYILELEYSYSPGADL